MHGGDIYRNRVELDFSVNVNPLGIPESVKKALREAVEDCSCYPDIRHEELKRAIMGMTGVSENKIVCANGASELFPAILRSVRKGKRNCHGIVIPVPSFSGYERAARVCGAADIIFYEMEAEKDFCLTRDIMGFLPEEAGVLFLANPNNPRGNCVEPELLEEILELCKAREIIVIIDECFMEFVEDGERYSFLRRTDIFPNLVIVRSFTKIFAIPGVRLGYLVCGDPVLAAGIAEELPEWNLSLFAQRAGVVAAGEKGYLEKSRILVREERDFLTRGLQALGLSVYPGEANFLMFYTEYDIAVKLLKRGILIRDCSDYRGLGKGYYRIAVRSRDENEKLLAAMEDCYADKL